MKRKNLFVNFVCALLIILFIYTGMNKMIDYTNFKFQLGRSPFIQHMAGFISATLPAGEMLIALALVIPATRLLGLFLSFVLMALFTGYIWIMLQYSFDLPCSCGGILAAMGWKEHLVFNAVFTVLALAGLLLQSSLKNKSKQMAIQNIDTRS